MINAALGRYYFFALVMPHYRGHKTVGSRRNFEGARFGERLVVETLPWPLGGPDELSEYVSVPS
jgi:hypothetical protein